MSAIFGFSKLHKQHINSMHKTIKHRGENLETGGLNNVYFGVAKSDKSTDFSSGLEIEGDIMVAIAGNVTDQKHHVQSPKDILVGFREYNLTYFNRLEGSFAIAIQHKHDTYLIRDQTGLRTLCYSTQNGKLSFCVEGKGIYALPEFQKSLNRQSLFQYFSYSFVPLQNTMMQDVFEIPAGSSVKYSGISGSVSLQRYFEAEKLEKHHEADLQYWESRIREEVDAEISAKLEYHREAGVFLSGGLDSSIIAARVSKLHHKKPHTFSIHFGKKYPNEIDFARLVANKYDTIHHEVEIKPKSFIPKIWETIRYLDDPIGDPITIPNFELSKYAADKVSAIFNGEGGDPCFGGPKNIPMLISQWYGVKRPSNYMEKAYLNSYKRGYGYIHKLFSQELLDVLDEEEHLESLLTPFFKLSNVSFLDKLMLINMRLKGAHLILPKVERMLGANGFFPYSPLFSKKLVVSSMEMPSKFKLNSGIEKYILKRAFINDVPIEIINRPKSGMRVPVRYWFQGEMKKYVKHLFDPMEVKKAGIFNPATVKELLSYNTESGLQRHGLLIWMMMTFEIWRQIFIENKN